MKKVLIIIVILTAPFLMVAQNNSSSSIISEENITITLATNDEVKTDMPAQKTAEAKFRAKAKDMNYKKSNDIISVKAYRKSLQIKVKEVKIC
jgi:hypothetical protein